jgi:hypothetical protein
MFKEVKGRKIELRIIKQIEIHGLKQCVKHCNDSGEKILCNVSHNRDYNAAKNIVFLFQYWLQHKERPSLERKARLKKNWNLY